MTRPDPRALIAEARKMDGYLEHVSHLVAVPKGAESLRRLDALLKELADALEANLPASLRDFPKGTRVRVIGVTIAGNGAYIGQTGFVAADGPDSDGDVTLTLDEDPERDITVPAQNLVVLSW